MEMTGGSKQAQGAWTIIGGVILLLSGCVLQPGVESGDQVGLAALPEASGQRPLPRAQEYRDGHRAELGTQGRMSSRLHSLPRPEAVEETAVAAVPSGRGRWMPQRIAVHVVRMPAREFFESLVSQDPDLNMVVHPDVTDTISVDLKNVTVDEVVALVCEMHQLDCQPFAARSREGVRGYKIFPWQLSTRTYHVDFLSVVRDGYSMTTVTTGNKSEISITKNSKEQISTTVTPSAAGSSMRTEYKSDFWSDLENTIVAILQLGLVVAQVTEETNEQGRTSKKVIRERKGLIKPDNKEKQIYFKKNVMYVKEEKHPASSDKVVEGGGMVGEALTGEQSLMPNEKGVMINRLAGLITVRAYPREHQDITEFLQQLRQRSQRQVILEAKILEVTLNDGSQFGIDWLAINRGIGGRSTLSYTAADASGLSVSTGSGNEGSANRLLLAHPPGWGQPINLALRAHDFIGLVRLLQQQGRVQVLSSPRVATVNNQKAVIKVGSDEYFITGMHPGSVTGSGSDRIYNPPTLTMESMFTGISLDVTPQVGEGEMVTLHVHPLVTEVQDKNKSFIIDDRPQNLPLAYAQMREADSIIRVRNGEMAVIGGLMKERTLKREDRLPLVGQLPLVGGLFGREEKSVEKSELVILLRPIVVEGDGDWQEQAERGQQRVQSAWQGNR
ncbi:MAG: pilus (MSHA type) biogenesis protein MshL [Magnetococcales bacterium]|nr:pilus (MSHA type) biogenesis protein MshL [Magnetococcales bacterium]